MRSPARLVTPRAEARENLRRRISREDVRGLQIRRVHTTLRLRLYDEPSFAQMCELLGDRRRVEPQTASLRAGRSDMLPADKARPHDDTLDT